MSFIRNPHLVQSHLYALLGFYLFSIFLLALTWEFKLEGVAMGVLDLPYDGDFEVAERWRFVLTSTGFAVLAMVVPFVLLKRLIGSLHQSYNNLVVAQAQSDSLARHDPLSGLLNRRVFHEQLATRLDQPGVGTAVFLIDLDRFKQINDTHGHAAGDVAICTVADTLREATAGWQAAVARLGGDEFALAVTGRFSRLDLATLAETILAKIAAAPTGLPGVAFSATMGIAVWSPKPCCSTPTARCIAARTTAARCSIFTKPASRMRCVNACVWRQNCVRPLRNGRSSRITNPSSASRNSNW
jgi:diguanylate cyclase (GGDEF)-like protein